MNKFMSFVVNFFVVFSLIFLLIPVAHAGDIIQKGTVLEEDSYVFTIEEATRLLNRVDELEKKEEALQKYIQLDEIRTRQVDLYKLNLDYTSTQLDYYIDLSHTNQSLIDRYSKRKRYDTIENIGFLVLGVALTTTSFIVTDNIIDGMNQN